MKRYLALFMALIFSLGTITFVQAEEEQKTGIYVQSEAVDEKVMDFFEEKAEHLMDVVQNNLTRNGFDVDVISIGTPFKLGNTDKEIYLFPVMDNGEIISFIQIFYDAQGKARVEVGRFMADEFINGRTYNVTNKEDGEFGHDVVEVASSHLTKQSINAEIINTSSIIYERALDNVSTMRVARASSRYLSVGWQPQSSPTTCWAATMAMVVNYMNNDSLSCQQVVRDTGYSSGATLSKAKGYYQSVYGLRSSMDSYGLYFDEIMDSIDNGAPIHYGLSGGSTGHSVCVMGYFKYTYGNSEMPGYVTLLDPAMRSYTYDADYVDNDTYGMGFVHGGYDSSGAIYDFR